MDVQPVVERLRGHLADLPLREVEAAAALDAAMRHNRAGPAVYVMPMGERAQSGGLLGRVEQKEQRLFGVVLVLPVLDFARASATGLDLVLLRQRIKRALVGWLMDATGEPVRFEGGALTRFDGDGQLWWADEFLVTGYWSNP